MKNYLLLLLSLWVLSSCKKDDPEPGTLYLDPIYDEVSMNSAPPGMTAGMDIYQANGSNESNRPVIIYAHGGAFVTGTRDQASAVHFCTQMARRGYVAVSISYHLEPNLNFADSLAILETVFKALGDTKEAIRYLKHSVTDLGNPYDIDTNHIYGAGNSAGAILMVQSAYMDEDELNPLLDSILQANGGIKGNGSFRDHNSDMAAVINLCGGIKSTTWLDADEPPILSFHGVDDDVVPYDCGTILSGFSGGVDVLRLCGSGSLHPAAQAIGIRSQLHSYPGLKHSPWVDGLGNPTPLMDQVIDRTALFLYDL